MKMRIITIKSSEDFHAGQKAPSDIINILSNKFDVRNILINESLETNLFKKINKRLRYFYYFITARMKKEIVILQFPFPETSKILNKMFMISLSFLNVNKTIILIHDINGLRYNDRELHNVEMNRLKKFKYVIVHNQFMEDELVRNGIKANFYKLNLFDYLCNYDNNLTERKISGKLNVLYAGNLKKSPFIFELEDNKMKFKLNLYGVGIDKDVSDKIRYMGKYPANELPNKLKGNLGLIWDGKLDDSDENIGLKNYTKYNNPHKLSCYIAAGLPVIVWRKAAIANFVKKNNIGYLIDNIYDINLLNLTDYNEKVNNVKKIQNQVRNGEYTIRVIDNILKDMELKR